ncbi:hypothetical protein CASFOL_006150 [Castilleja foliolosa]|uniref:S-protein homolog n=1 Tax=Castilleja foliolosa TaxID=1961234 RepID=A0ABD3E7K0_9LAMI
MSHKMMKTLLLLCLGLLNILAPAHACSLSVKVNVHVVNNLPSGSKLKIHCASGDDDLGFHTLSINKEFQWGFCANPRTLFFCHLWWGPKQRAFDVFVSSILIYPLHVWSARADGIYEAVNGTFVKKFDWK